MTDGGGGSPHDLVVQTWIMYSIAIGLYVLRVFARYKRIGLRWQAGDYLMLLAVCWYTAFAVTNIALAEGGGSSLYPPGQYETFTPEDIRAREKGSKIEFASEHCMVHTLYTCKACMLLIYLKLTLNLKEHLFVRIAAGYTFCGWLATVLVLFFNCHPLSGYWTLPPPQKECATYFRFEIVQAVFNISSDIFILGVVLPMFIRLRMPWKDKVPVLFIFSMGFAVVICACTSKYFTFTGVRDPRYQFWYLREVSVAMYVTNLPYVWSLARQTFKILQSTDTETGSKIICGRYTSDRMSKFRSKSGGDSRNRTSKDPDISISPTDANADGVEMKVFINGTTDFAKCPNGSETLSWVQSGGEDWNRSRIILIS